MPGPGSVQHVRSERKTFHAERTVVYRPASRPPTVGSGQTDLGAVTSAPAATIVLCAGSLIREAFS